ELTGLVQNHAAIFRVSVVAEIGAFIDEALAVGVDHDAERIGVLLEAVADGKIPILGRIAIPADRVATRPVAAGARADLHLHTDAVTRVEPRAADLGEVPRWPEIARAPFGVGLEAAGRENHRLGADVLCHALLLDAQPVDAPVIREQRQGAGL